MRPAPLNPFGRARSVLFLCFLIACLQGLRWGASILARLLPQQAQAQSKTTTAAPTAPAKPMRRDRQIRPLTLACIAWACLALKGFGS